MKTIDDLRVSGQRVRLRLDLNVPLKGGHITDDGKIEACLPTINALRNRGAAVVVCSHLGRPGGAPNPAYSLAPEGYGWLESRLEDTAPAEQGRPRRRYHRLTRLADLWPGVTL
jgi:3-phosphoglycerate kinase